MSMLPDAAPSVATSARYRPELAWDQIVCAEIVSVTSIMRRNQRWSLDSYYHHRADSPPPHMHAASAAGSQALAGDGADAAATLGASPLGDASQLGYYDYLGDISLRDSSGLEHLRMFTRAAAARDHRLHAGPLPPLPESPLLQGFSKLKAQLTVIQNLRDLDPLHLLAPFLHVIKSGETNGHITGAALESVEKFIEYRVLDPHHPDLPRAVTALAEAVTHCRFEGTDIVSDEVVLSRVLRLFRVLVLSDAGKKCIDDKSLCAMVEVAFGIHSPSRISEMLRKAAEETLVALVQAAFERLAIITKEREHRDALRSRSPLTKSLRNRTSTLDDPINALKIGGLDGEMSFTDVADPAHGQQTEPSSARESTANQTPQPFGLPSILEITRVLISLIDPKNRAQTDSLHRLLGLRLLRRGLEVSGKSLAKWVSYAYHVEKRVQSEAANAKHAPALPTEAMPHNVAEMKIETEHPATVVSVNAIDEQLGSEGTHRIVDVGSPRISNNPQHLQEDEDGISAESFAGSAEDTTGVPLLADDGLAAPAAQASADASTAAAADSAEEAPPAYQESQQQSQHSQQQQRNQLTQGVQLELERMAIYLKDMITNDLCKSLFLLLQSTNVTYNNPPSWQALSLITQLLKTILALFNTTREYMLPQQQWLIQFLIQRCQAGVVGWDIEDWAVLDANSFHNFSRGSPEPPPTHGQQRVANEIVVGEVRELYLEALLQLSRSPTFFSELYLYYDSDMQCPSHLFEELIGFFAKSTFPDATPGGPVTSPIHQNLCYDGLLLFLRRLVDRRNVIGRVPESLPHNSFEPRSSRTRSLEPPTADLDPSAPYAPQTLVKNRERKRIMLEGALIFNESVKKGIKFFQEHGFLPQELTPEAMANFLATTPNLSKACIGEYFAKPDNVQTLSCYVQLCDFRGKRIDEALRILLEKFRIPGESQQIERIMDAFSHWYFSTIQDDPTREIATESDTAVLAFSVIMLNTDQHNKQVKRRMTFKDYSKNVRGLNSGKDFSPEYLRSIYDAIKATEIVMAEEQGGELGFNFQWRQLLARASTVSQLSNRETSIYNRDMFVSVWGPILASVFYAFDNAEDHMSLQKAIAGVQHCAILAAHYDLPNVFDYIIISLLRMSGFNRSSRDLPVERDMASLQAADAGSVSDAESAGPRRRQRPPKPDRWAIEIGGNYRGQVAAVLAFNLASDYGNTIRESWRHIISAIGNMFLHQVLPMSLLVGDHLAQGSIVIPRIRPVNAPSRAFPANTARKEAGIFSTLSQLLSLGSQSVNDDDSEIHPEDVALERLAVETVSACRIPELIADTRFLEEGTLTSLIESLTQAFYVETPKLEAAAGGDGGAVTVTTSEPPSAGADAPREFAPASVFYLELLFNITMRNRDRIQLLWPTIRAHVASVFTRTPPAPAGFIERATAFLMRLLLRLMHMDDIQTAIFSQIDKASKLPSETLNAIADSLIAGLLAVIKTDIGIVSRHPERWETVLHLLSATSGNAAAAPYGFEAACLLVSNHPDSPVTAENFGECVDLLISFVAASSGSAAAGAGGSSESIGGTAASPSRASLLLADQHQQQQQQQQLSQSQSQQASMSSQQVALQSQRHSEVRASPRLPRSSGGAEPRVPQVTSLDRALRAVDRLYGLQTKIPRLVSATGIHPQRAWFELWLPVLSGLGQLCYHPSREVRQQAQTLLQRSLLSAELDESLGTHPAPSATETRIDAFDNVLFPLLDELLKPEVHAMDPAGIEETRVRAVGLVDKVFLRFLPRLVKSKELLRVWVRVLNYAGAFLTVGGRQRREYVVEGVLESLKNLLLVLSAEGVLRPPGAEPTGAPELNLWDLTWTTIQPFLPSLRDELFPPAAIAAAAAAASRAATQPQPQPPPADAQPAAAAAPQ